MRARTAVLELLKGSSEWRQFFKACCETSPFRLRSQTWQFREELAERGHHFPKDSPELEDALLKVARELMPNSPAAQWDEEWAFALCKDALARFAKHCARLTLAEAELLDLSPQDVWDEKMYESCLNNDPATFRAALKGWERSGLEALGALGDANEGSVA